MNCDILPEHIQSLLEHFAKSLYKAKECEKGTMAYEIMGRCEGLLKLDYNVIEISNRGGELSSHYPSAILIPEYEKRTGASNGSSGLTSGTGSQMQQQTIYESPYDAIKMRDMINRARFARCRARFPIPVILYKGKYICRSATLSGGPEIYGRSGLDYFFYGADNSQAQAQTEADVLEAQEASFVEDAMQEEIKQRNGDWQLFDRVRSQDIKLLKHLNVGTIVDFMVEKKKVKFGMNVTSSEKVDKEKRYSDFTIISLPYPGCEFFRDYRDNNYSGISLVFDWSQGQCDATIGVPEDTITAQLQITWDDYKNWDLVVITQNYLKLLLKHLQDNSSGILIHCISGWDRTPLFVSLLRLSLWADGVIHQSLSSTQILYLTIAYDWYLFGHNLPDRLNKGEEIFFFCFYALKYIIEDEFSTLGHRHKSKHSSGSSSVGVLRTDSECMLDGILFDGESRGSSISLNSACSCISSKSQQEGTTSQINSIFHDEFTNGNLVANQSLSQDSNNSISVLSNDSAGLTPNLNWSPQPRRTSPVSVPNANSKVRQRQESSSSISVGSWQMISGTGSLRSVDSSCTSSNSGISNNQNARSSTSSTATSNMFNMAAQQDSTNTLVDDECFLTLNNDSSAVRRDRLNGVRSLFYHCYCSTVGFKFKNGAETTFGALLGNFAEKVGFAQRTT